MFKNICILSVMSTRLFSPFFTINFCLLMCFSATIDGRFVSNIRLIDDDGGRRGGRRFVDRFISFSEYTCIYTNNTT